MLLCYQLKMKVEQLQQHGHDVVRVARAVHQRIAVANAFALLHVDVDAAGQRVFLLLAIVPDDEDLTRTLGDFAVLDFGTPIQIHDLLVCI